MEESAAAVKGKAKPWLAAVGVPLLLFSGMFLVALRPVKAQCHVG